ncbi:MBL fold metallo-hydrolase [Lonepinella sp. MS14435]|uniref:MBL fold metallo-hydrolase n=1 Tax=unclassified Lonepinella TaxID=2642006 RepID=UPI0036DC4CCD
MNIDIIPVTAFQQNCSIIWNDEKKAAIIDPGGEAPKLIKRIEQNGLDLQGILITHGHLDHVGAATKLKQHFNVEIIGSNSLDKILFAALPQQSRQFGVFEIDAFEPDRWLDNEGEILKIAGFEFEILHLPGHAPGHIGFIEHKEGIAFTGDVLFKQGIGRTDLLGGNHTDLINSIKQKMYKLPDDMLVLPGHGPHTTIGQEKLNNPFVK